MSYLDNFEDEDPPDACDFDDVLDFFNLADDMHELLVELLGDCSDIEDDPLCWDLAERVFEKGYLE